MHWNHRYLRVLARTGLLGLLFAHGGVPAGAAEVKIGFVNVAIVLDQAPQAAEARARIEREFAPRDRELLAQQQQVRTLEDTLVKNAAILSAASASGRNPSSGISNANCDVPGRGS